MSGGNGLWTALESALRRLRRSGQTETAVAAGPAAVPAPYRGHGGSDAVLERYRPTLGSLPFPAIEARPGQSLPFRLAAASLAARKREWSRLLVGIPFAAIGLLLIRQTARSAALPNLLLTSLVLAIAVAMLWPWLRPLFSGALLDPRVEVDRYLVCSGQSFRVLVEQPGPARVKRLAVRLVMTEHALRGDGSSEIDKNDVVEIQLCQQTALEIKGDSPFVRLFEATIPGDSMHSFVSLNNRVEWAVRVDAEIDGWPDVKQTFPIAVLPAE